MPRNNPKNKGMGMGGDRKRSGFRGMDRGAAGTPEASVNADAEKQRVLEAWVPRTALGKMVKNGEITSLDEIFEKNMKILEPEIVDMLVPALEEKIIDVTKTAKMREAGRQFGFRVSVLVGDKNAYIGLGVARDKEKWPAMKKASRIAKVSLVKVKKGCGSWECVCGLGHSVPFKVEGKASSVRVVLLPAPRGTGLVAGNNMKDVLKFIDMHDVWCRTTGSTSTKLNFIRAAIDALANTSKMRLSNDIQSKMEKGMGGK